MFSWFFECINLSEEETEKVAGVEVVLYLVYLKWSAILFLSIFLLGGIPLLVLYANEAENIE